MGDGWLAKSGESFTIIFLMEMWKKSKLRELWEAGGIINNGIMSWFYFERMLYIKQITAIVAGEANSLNNFFIDI